MSEDYYRNVSYDPDPPETEEWYAALESLIQYEGTERARYLLNQLARYAEQHGVVPPVATATAYQNTIPPQQQPEIPDDEQLFQKLLAVIRWNAVAMVLHAGKVAPDVGGHIASYASSAILYEVGFNYFFRGHTENQLGDLVYIQGHSSPGIYARAFLEGRLTREQLDGFRQEAFGQGLSSYPHPWLMPQFWQFPTVSMGLGPIQSIYQARMLKYITNRGLGDQSQRKVWTFVGDGEMDEPESAGALHIASKERLDNLIFVVCCNLQRLDGPVRGSGKIVQELEQLYRGAGWNVIKVIWNRQWDKLFARDSKGILVEKLQSLKDGDLQRFKAMGAKYFREHFFNQDEYLKSLVDDFSDDDLAELEYGGHDFQKVYAAYDQAVNMDNGRPTVILAQTVKGYGMGEAGESQNISHQQKKMDEDALKAFCQRFDIPLNEEQIEKLTYYKPEDDSEIMRYLHNRRQELGGYVPSRPERSANLSVPELSAFNKVLEGSGDREISTTMAFVRIISVLLRDKNLKDRLVPIIPDEARTFGMEGLFRQIGIYAVEGQLFESHDQKQIMAYREAKDGQLLEEGLTEAGSMSSWIAAGTSHNNNNLALIPFYIYYAMFGYQRTGDLMWAAGDVRAKGFLMGGTAGRTTLAGEGLQHQDGHNPVCFCMLPTCRVYDPTFGYELAVIIQHGIKEMYHDDEDVFYYLTLMNENYYHPPMPKGVEEGIIKGMYHYQKAASNAKTKVQLMGCGTILNEVIKAAELLKNDFNVHADIWSVTSFGELRKDGLEVERQHRLGNAKKSDKPYVTKTLENQKGPAIAATDYVRLYADLVRQFMPLPYYVLGTDGFGRSDSRDQLRSYFEVDANWIAYTAIVALVEQGEMAQKQVTKAQEQYNIDSRKGEPWHH